MATACVHNCSMCSYFSNQQDDLITHVIRRHQYDRNFIIHCSHALCGLSFSNLKSFKSHVYRKHGTLRESDNSEIDLGMESVGSVQESTVNKPLHASFPEAAYILTLKAKHRLSQSAINDVCDSTRDLFSFKVKDMKQSLHGTEFVTSFSDTLFCGLETHHKQQKFFTQHFGMVRPVSQKLGTVNCSVMKGNKRMCVANDVKGYYVPLKEQLQALLSMPEVQQCLQSCTDCPSDCIDDICDAYYVTTHTLSNSHALKLCLYTDDFEIVNPIGCHRKKHKISAFYWTLLNIPAQYRSQISSIQLLALAKTKDLRRFGTGLLLQDFLQTLTELENGIEFCFEAYGVKRYSGFLVCVLADTPAAQLIGGFKEGVGSAISPCRSCDAKQTDLAQIHTAAGCPMRDQQEHTDRVAYLERQNRRGFEYWSKRWGINGPSVLSDLAFDVTKCILHDPMHVILEGVAKVELKAMLKVFIHHKKYFSLDLLNKSIQHYSFSNAELKDKPEIIDRQALEPNAVFPQTAAAMKNLLLNFPHIIGSSVADDDEHWHNFLLLVQILILSITPVISVHTADTLQALVAMHNKKFVNLYSEDLFTPKFHYLVHLPQKMRLFGPLRNHWCMRFESKNGFFKLQKWFNFRNLPKSLSFYHQNWMCLQMTQTSGYRSNAYLYAGDKVKQGVVVDLHKLPGMREVIDIDFGEEMPLARVMCSKNVTANGLTYCKGTVLLESMDDQNIQFVEVQTVVVHEQVKYLYCHCLEVLDFDSHRNAFRVQRTANVSVRRMTDLLYKWPQLVHHHDEDFFVTLQNVDDVWSL